MCLHVCSCTHIYIHKLGLIIFKAGNVVHSWAVSCLPRTLGGQSKPPPSPAPKNQLPPFPLQPCLPLLPHTHRYPLLPRDLFPLSESSGSRSAHVWTLLRSFRSLYKYSATRRALLSSHLERLPPCHAPASCLCCVSISGHFLVWHTCLFYRRTMRTPLSI